MKFRLSPGLMAQFVRAMPVRRPLSSGEVAAVVRFVLQVQGPRRLN